MNRFRRPSVAFPRLRPFLLVMLSLALFGGWSSGLASAQNLPGVTTSSYGYFSPDGSTGLTLVHLEPDDPSLAGDLVSPQYADEFFDGFTMFTDYDFAGDLDAAYINQVDDADEYMVFSGDLNSYDGIRPGYVILLSSSQQVFLMVGYQTDADDLFDLAAETISEGEAPEEFGDFFRVDLEDFDLESSGSQGGFDTADTGEEFCFNEPALGTFDANNDGAVTVTELEEWTDIFPEVEESLNVMEANGYDSIRYVGC